MLVRRALAYQYGLPAGLMSFIGPKFSWETDRVIDARLTQRAYSQIRFWGKLLTSGDSAQASRWSDRY
jgi:hypothetical protein